MPVSLLNLDCCSLFLDQRTVATFWPLSERSAASTASTQTSKCLQHTMVSLSDSLKIKSLTKYKCWYKTYSHSGILPCCGQWWQLHVVALLQVIHNFCKATCLMHIWIKLQKCCIALGLTKTSSEIDWKTPVVPRSLTACEMQGQTKQRRLWTNIHQETLAELLKEEYYSSMYWYSTICIAIVVDSILSIKNSLFQTLCVIVIDRSAFTKPGVLL